MRQANKFTGLVVLCWLAAGCGDDPPCGGPCDMGVCDEATDLCVDPWLLSCPAQTNECSAEQPYRCDGALPSYDCSQCGCSDGLVCDFGHCYEQQTLDLQRMSYTIPDDMPRDDYFALLDYAMTADAMTYSELVTELDRLLRQDGRRTALLLGESHGSDDEQSVGYQIMRDLKGLGWPLDTLGIEGDTPILDVEPLADLGIASHNFAGDLTNNAHCADAMAAVGMLNSESMYVQYSGSGHTSKEICHQNMHWSICNLPHTSECLTEQGYKAVTVILFDPNPWLWSTDRTLLWRLGDLMDEPADFDRELEANLARWQQTMDLQATETAFDAQVNGTLANVRVVRAQHADDVFIAFFARPDRPAYMTEAFRAIWNVQELRDFLLLHQMQPGNCSTSWNLAPGEETLWLWCSTDGFELTATVDGITFEVTESATGPTTSSRIVADDRQAPMLPAGY